MDHKEFKSTLNQALIEFGFKKQKSHYYKDYQEILMVFYPQKSGFGATYYIEYGYCIKAFNGHLPYPRVDETEFRWRLGFDFGPGHRNPCYQVDYDVIGRDEFESQLREKAREVIIPDGSNDMQVFLNLMKGMHPNRIPTRTKKFLGMPWEEA